VKNKREEIMRKFKLCACGCGRIITTPNYPNQKYIIEHKPKDNHRKKIKKRLTYEIFVEYKDLIYKLFQKRIIECLIKSPNKKIKESCITTRPRRGSDRGYSDKYIGFSFTVGNTEYTSEAHIVACMLAHGDPEGDCSLHDCDVKMCCHPDHLYFGTRRQNNNDYCNRAMRSNKNSNLTRLEKSSIGYYLEEGQHTNVEIAKGVGCSTSTVSKYKNDNCTLTTDGTEVIGEDWIPIEIPEAGKLQKERNKRKLIEILDFAAAIESTKELHPKMSLKEIHKMMGISYMAARRYKQLNELDLDEADYYLTSKDILKKYNLR